MHVDLFCGVLTTPQSKLKLMPAFQPIDHGSQEDMMREALGLSQPRGKYIRTLVSKLARIKMEILRWQYLYHSSATNKCGQLDINLVTKPSLETLPSLSKTPFNMKFSFSGVSVTLLATALCSPVIIAKGQLTHNAIYVSPLTYTDEEILDNTVDLSKKSPEVAYDFGEYSVSSKRNSEVKRAHEVAEDVAYTVTEKSKKRTPEVAYDFGEYSVSSKRASVNEKTKRTPEEAYDFGEYSVSS